MWIEAGYRLFGQIGPEALNIERLSIIVGINRSSFYHYFGDISVFETQLLDHHIHRFKVLGEAISQCQNLDPDVIRVVTMFKEEMVFQRQLLIHESISRYKLCLNAARAYTEEKIFRLWSDYIKVQKKSTKEFSLYQTVRDYYLLHFDQSDEKEIQEVLQDIRILLNEEE